MTQQVPLSDDELLAYLEGAGSAEAKAQMTTRLTADPAARATLAEWQRQNAAIDALYQPMAQEPVPERLLKVIRQAEAQTAARATNRQRLWQVAAVIALMSVGTSAGWFARGLFPAAPVERSLASAAMQAHATYVVEVLHPVEVQASEVRHLETWLSKRLGYDIRPPDFAAAGFVLMGGRVVPSDQGAAALFMYDNAQGQRITLYVAPQGAASTTAFQFAQSGALQSFYWMDRDLSYAVVGEIPRGDLRRVALAAYDQLI